MTIDEPTRAKAKAAWDATIQREQEVQEAQQRLTAARKEVASFYKRMKGSWDKLSDEAKNEVRWTAQHTHGAAPVEAALVALRETAGTIEFSKGRKAQGHYSCVSIDAIRAVALALDLRSYGSGHREKPLPDERLLFQLCHSFDGRVTEKNVRNALKSLPRK